MATMKGAIAAWDGARKRKKKKRRRIIRKYLSRGFLAKIVPGGKNK